VHITTPYGTDFTVSIAGHLTYTTAKSELTSVVNAQFPGGEEAVTPAEGTGTGIIVVDKCLPHPEGLLAHPIRLRIESGKIVDIRGDSEADMFCRWLDENGDENSRSAAEVSLGCNPHAIFMGSMRQDRFVLGSSHIGFGGNRDLGGNILSRLHFDVIMSKPTVTVDGKVVVQDGHMLL
jgi:2,5-dihydroxypyridine 5,6-dioxygenase